MQLKVKLWRIYVNCSNFCLLKSEFPLVNKQTTFFFGDNINDSNLFESSSVLLK